MRLGAYVLRATCCLICMRVLIPSLTGSRCAYVWRAQRICAHQFSRATYEREVCFTIRKHHTVSHACGLCDDVQSISGFVIVSCSMNDTLSNNNC